MSGQTYDVRFGNAPGPWPRAVDTEDVVGVLWSRTWHQEAAFKMPSLHSGWRKVARSLHSHISVPTLWLLNPSSFPSTVNPFVPFGRWKLSAPRLLLATHNLFFGDRFSVLSPNYGGQSQLPLGGTAHCRPGRGAAYRTLRRHQPWTATVLLGDFRPPCGLWGQESGGAVAVQPELPGARCQQVTGGAGEVIEGVML